MCRDVIVEKAEARPLRGEDRGLFPEKMELGIASDTEADEVVDDGVRAEVAPRRATVVGGVEPAAAAKQTVRTSRGSCGVCHAC